METVEILNAVVVAVGVPSIVVTLIFMGRKLQVLDVLEETIERIKNNVKVIGDALIYADIGFDTDKLQTYSPVSITEGGLKYLENIGFLKIYKRHSEDFIDYIKSEEPMDAYDVEVAARKSVIALMGREYFKEVKRRLYNSGREETVEFLKVAGIYVRDRYLEEDREIAG